MKVLARRMENLETRFSMSLDDSGQAPARSEEKALAPYRCRPCRSPARATAAGRAAIETRRCALESRDLERRLRAREDLSGHSDGA